MDTCTKNLEKFADLDACLLLINELNTGLGDDILDQRVRSDTERLVDSFRKTIDKYQEQPELLEAHVPNLIERLTEHLPDIKDSPNKYHTTFKFLYQLIKVIGFKSIGRRFPHETSKLPLLVELLFREDPQDKLNWQTRFVLIVWLSIVILAPFDLVKFDTDSNEQKIQDKIYSTLIRSLANHDSSQHVTAFCLARFFSRPDMLREAKLLNVFIAEALEELKGVKTSTTSSLDDVKIIGYLRTLAYLFKFMPRNELKRMSGSILEVLTNLDIEKINRELINHMIIKLVQRVGMAMLPKRVAAWRYKRGSRILGQSQPLERESQLASEHTIRTIDGNEDATEQVARQAKDNEDEGEEEIETHSAETLESILNILFVAAQNGQTKIRWSAAKGIARLASRLSRERASDVIDIVLGNYFNANESSEYAWHGGCLTLAEMSRQGLILEEKLPRVVEIVGKAIIYDKIKGSFAVGSHVREAACYVLWAMSRTYEDQLLEPHIGFISINLLCTMLFDRELQCRRAASATFQELVGRQGTFNVEGISILNSLDYQSVGVRQLAYTELASQVARFGRKYYEPFIVHLIERKLAHWDIQIRRLASVSLAALMVHPYEERAFELIRDGVFAPISRMCEQSVDVNAKHGAILSLAEVVKSLVALGFKFDGAQEVRLVELIGNMALNCSKQLASKQQAPNFIEAIVNLTASAEIAELSYRDETLDQWERIILNALDSDNAEIRAIGSQALLSLYRFFYKFNKSSKDRLLTRLNQTLMSANESSRCGALRSLAKLGCALSDAPVNGAISQPRATTAATVATVGLQQTGGEIRLDSDTPDIILMALTGYVGKPTKEGDNVLANAKAEACEALVDFIKSLDKTRLVVSSQWLRLTYEVLLEKTEDYTFDKRGDIGVVVRRAAVRALQELTLFLLSIGLNGPVAEQLARTLAKVLQQAVSYNNLSREQAALAFYRLLVAASSMAQPPLADECIPHKAEIFRLFERFHVDQEGEPFNWRDDSTPIFVNLLALPAYSQDLWIGLMPAIGQASDLCAKQHRDAFNNYMQSLDQEPQKREQILETFLETLEKRDLAGRLVSSGLIVADYLLTSGLLHDSNDQFRGRFVRLCWQARGQGDPKRLVAVGQVLCSMLQFSGPVQIDCLRYCLTLLASGYSKVRVFTAANLYTGLLTYQSELEENLVAAASASRIASASSAGEQMQCDGQTAALATPEPEAKDEKPKEIDLEQAMELLAQSNWSEPLEKVRTIRDQICSCLLIEL